MDFEVRFRAIKEFREEIREAVEDAVEAAGTYMALHVPYHSGKMYRAINVSKPKFHAGGAGGGGFYEAHAGLDETIAPHAEHVIEGTGLFNRTTPTNGIYPATGNVFAFEKNGEGTVYAAWTKGQEPQRAWFEDAQDIARDVIARKVAGT
jgi:hypothetical protein